MRSTLAHSSNRIANTPKILGSVKKSEKYEGYYYLKYFLYMVILTELFLYIQVVLNHKPKSTSI